MLYRIIITSPNIEKPEEVVINSASSVDEFAYKDSYGAKCNIKILKDGLIINRCTNDYKMYLDLNSEPKCKIISAEGEIYLSVKIVDFNHNDDILVMRYLVEGQAHKIEIIRG